MSLIPPPSLCSWSLSYPPLILHSACFILVFSASPSLFELSVFSNEALVWLRFNEKSSTSPVTLWTYLEGLHALKHLKWAPKWWLKVSLLSCPSTGVSIVAYYQRLSVDSSYLILTISIHRQKASRCMCASSSFLLKHSISYSSSLKFADLTGCKSHLTSIKSHVTCDANEFFIYMASTSNNGEENSPLTGRNLELLWRGLQLLAGREGREGAEGRMTDKREERHTSFISII